MSQRTLKDYAILSLKGMAMGAADVVPGVSGGTIAFISGIYQELIESISNLNFGLLKTLQKDGFASFWKAANANFLIALIVGIFVSAISVLNLMHYLLENHPIPLWAFFFGLVAASIIFVGRQIKKWNTLSILFFILSAIGAYAITKIGATQGSDNLAFIFFSGAIAICAMILPGISGSFILVLLGSYATVSEAVHNLDIKKVVTFMLGCVVGLLSFARILKWLFKNHENLTLAFLTGFILGSLNKIWPWKKPMETIMVKGEPYVIKEDSVLPSNFDGNPQLLIAISFMILGFVLIFILEKLASKK